MNDLAKLSEFKLRNLHFICCLQHNMIIVKWQADMKYI